MAQTFDYSNGSAVVQGGIIYYSPNCTRPVIIPSHLVYSSNPFRQPCLNSSMFKQSLWWSEGWAWLSFVPLVPSFVFTPFEPLCAMPRIEEVTFSYLGQSRDIQRETRFRMNEDDIQCWNVEEKQIIQVAHVIQLRYGISSSLPPEPSSFHYERAHKTHKVTKRMIYISREWFAIWMGFVSYLIAKATSQIPNGEVDTSSQTRTGTITCGTNTNSPRLGLMAFASTHFVYYFIQFFEQYHSGLSNVSKNCITYSLIDL